LLPPQQTGKVKLAGCSVQLLERSGRSEFPRNLFAMSDGSKRFAHC
jgi:hypothetical protein